MKKIATLFYCVLATAFSVNAQMFWVENFEGGSTAGMLASAYTGPNGTWTITSTGSEGAFRNEWYVSCAENGHTTGACGTGCVALSTTATLSTLHVGSTLLSDMGASYYAGAASATNRRAESPTINCTGKYTITVSFYYIEDGDGTNDNATVWYYDGTTWALLDDPAKTAPICPLGQGLWTHYTYALPVSANNNPNVKLGFRWVDNADGVGTDPSFAVDSVGLSAATSSAVPVPSFTASPGYSVCRDSCVTFTNTSTGTIDSFTWSMTGGVPIATPHASPVAVCFSVSGTYTMTLNVYKSGTAYPVNHTVTVNPAPAAIVGAHSICAGFTTPLTNATSGGVWSSSTTSVATVGSASGVVTGVAAGTTTISYTLGNGCHVLFTFTVFPLPCTTGISEVNENYEGVELFPNPTTDELTISIVQGAYASYDITNEVGQSIINAPIYEPQTKVNTRVLPAGLYYIRLKGNAGNVVQKFVKL